ncbi:MAG TPA: GTPase Era, partial [Candidatus Binataceae bacterium]|nr:GTPase Era [Candidatus Binataceae bacterium]
VPYRCGYVALAGRSNVGKSTLLNRLVGEKVAIVSPLPQTTRGAIVGIRTDADAQLIIVDAPGIHQARRALNQRMVQRAQRAIAQADAVAIVVEPRPVAPQDRELIATVSERNVPTAVVINKIDLVARPNLIPLAEQWLRAAPKAEIVPVSALTGENVEELVRTLKAFLPLGPALMPADQATAQSVRELAGEIVREKLFLQMRQEIPFSTAVQIERWEELPERKLTRIGAAVVVERDSHKGMVIGAGGARLKEVGQAARLELEAILGQRVYLELQVRVENNWTRDPRRLDQFGL